jgi:hypothetical protein
MKEKTLFSFLKENKIIPSLKIYKQLRSRKEL